MSSTSMLDFKIEKILGKGSFGSVYLVTRKADKKIYALKTVILEKLNKKEQENSVNEVRILASVNHPNVIGYKEAFWNEKESSLNIVMEYADDGDLQTKIQKMKKEGGMFTENLIWSYSIQMIEGLKALHDKKIMHRDLKSANIFLVKDKHQCKLGDMNVSKVIKDKVLLTQTGTPYYASPEVWNDKPYSYKSDLWSIGCVIYELCALQPPFHGKDLDDLYSNVCKGKVARINNIYSDDLWKMIKMLLQVDVNKRVDCDEFLKSKLIIKKKKELIEENKEFNYIENKLGMISNNSILLSTIKFKNINEIKSQLPKNKNYNDENINYSNINNNINGHNTNHTNKLSNISNITDNYLKGLNYNYDIKLRKNVSDIIFNYNNINNIFQNHRNNIISDIGNNNQKDVNSINRNSTELNDHIQKSKNNRMENNFLFYNYNIENKIIKNDEKPTLITSKKFENNNNNKKNTIKKKKKGKIINKHNNNNNKINTSNNSNKELARKKNLSSEYLNIINTNKECNRTKLPKEKVKKCNKINPLEVNRPSLKRTVTCRQNISKLKNDKNTNRKRAHNYSYLKLNESKGEIDYKYKCIIPFNSYSISEIRSKTPITYEKNNSRINSDVYNEYKYNCNNYNKRKEYSEQQRSFGYIRNNIKTSIIENDKSDIYNFLNNSKNNNVSKSISIISTNKNNIAKNNIIKKNIIQNRKAYYSENRPTSDIKSKRINNISINNNNSIVMNYNTNENILKEKLHKNMHSSKSYFNLDINNTRFKSSNSNSKSGSIKNHSTIHLNYDYDKSIFNDYYSPIRNNKYTINKNKNNYYHKKIQTTIGQKLTTNDNNINNKNYNNKNYNSNRLVINNSEIFHKKNIIKYNEKSIKKINNIKNNNSSKRSYDGKSLRERKKREVISNRDLTEPELLMLLNPIKGKESLRNSTKKKILNISLIDNLGQNIFLKQIKQIKPENTSNIKLNQYYVNSSINNNRNNMERNKGTQIFNNFYSINNIANSKIPVKVINVFN